MEVVWCFIIVNYFAANKFIYLPYYALFTDPDILSFAYFSLSTEFGNQISSV